MWALPFFFNLDARLLARSQYSEGPATGHLDTVVPFCGGGRDLVPLHKKVPHALYSNLSSLDNLMMAYTQSRNM